MIDWPTIGGIAAATASGAYGWWQRRKRKLAERPDAWDGEERRQGDPKLDGRRLVVLLEESEVRMPQHWLQVIDARVEHKLSNAMAAPLLRLSALEHEVQRLRETFEQKADELGERMNTLSGLVQRLIGRTFPNAPLE